MMLHKVTSPSQSHDRQSWSPIQPIQPYPLRQTSQHQTRGAWQSAKFHDENHFSYALITQVSEPISVHQALTGPNTFIGRKPWTLNMSRSFKNQTWELVDLPPDKSLISTKWIFRRKYNSDGSISRFKARFVVCGFSQ
jgi:hypothetical protein